MRIPLILVLILAPFVLITNTAIAQPEELLRAWYVNEDDLASAAKQAPKDVWYLFGVNGLFELRRYVLDEGRYPATINYFVLYNKVSKLLQDFEFARYDSAQTFEISWIPTNPICRPFDPCSVENKYITLWYLDAGPPGGNFLAFVNSEDRLTTFAWSDGQWPSWGPCIMDIDFDGLYEIVIPGHDQCVVTKTPSGQLRAVYALCLLGSYLPLDDFSQELFAGGAIVIKPDFPTCRNARWTIVRSIFNFTQASWMPLSPDAGIED
jgi:hypothetical protein